MTIPVTSSRVDVSRLEPTLAYRVDLMLNDPRMKGYRVVSGVRSRDEQVRLWEGWLARRPGFNLAADPNRVVGTSFDGLVIKGSYHMEQADGYGHAVDLRKPLWHSVSKAAGLIGEVGQRYGLQQVALGAGGIRNNEWWHLQARTFRAWIPGPVVPTPETPGHAGKEAMQIINDTENRRMWAGWDTDGTQHVREYGSYRGTDVGIPMPGIAFIIDEQVTAGKIIKVT